MATRQTVLDLMESERWTQDRDKDHPDGLTPEMREYAKELRERIFDETDAELNSILEIEDEDTRIRELDAAVQRAALMMDKATEARDAAMQAAVNAVSGRFPGAARRREVADLAFMSRSRMRQVMAKDNLGESQDGYEHRERVRRQFTETEYKTVDGEKVAVSGKEWLRRVFYDENKRQIDIAEEVGCAPHTVKAYLEHHFGGTEHDTRERDDEGNPVGAFRNNSHYQRRDAEESRIAEEESTGANA